MGQTPTIILGSAAAAWDILEKNSRFTSSRPRFIMGQEILSDNMRGLMSPNNDFWRRWRKVLHGESVCLLQWQRSTLADIVHAGSFMQKAADTYRPIQSLESKQLMHELLTDSKDYRTHIERYAASVIVTVTYGRRVHDIWKDEVVCFNRQSMDVLTSVNIPGAFDASSTTETRALTDATEQASTSSRACPSSSTFRHRSRLGRARLSSRRRSTSATTSSSCTKCETR